jgi:hypothetical protein
MKYYVVTITEVGNSDESSSTIRYQQTVDALDTQAVIAAVNSTPVPVREIRGVPGPCRVAPIGEIRGISGVGCVAAVREVRGLREGSTRNRAQDTKGSGQFFLHGGGRLHYAALRLSCAKFRGSRGIREHPSSPSPESCA